MSGSFDVNERPPPDALLVEIADYVVDGRIDSDLAYATARHCLLDALGCALLALEFPACVSRLGPYVEGTVVPGGARVPGTNYCLDPVKAAWDTGCLIRWLDFNDTWLAAEWGHPSDNLGGLLAVGDFLARQQRAADRQQLTVRELLTAMIKAHEIQGVMALQNSFNRVGLDHVVLVKLATTALVTRLLGGSHEQLVAALSHVWVDGQALRTYRHAPNTSARKSWAAGDACARAVQLSLLACRGEPLLPSALTARQWGFYDVLFKGKPFVLERPFGSYVMENVLFKVAFPAEFHAQTAAEAAVRLHPLVRDRLQQIERIEITTHESAIRIISKVGPLNNPADRDHCLQYMVAVPLAFGALAAGHYEDSFHQSEPIIDLLRERMTVREDPQYSADYLAPDKRAIANAVQVFFGDGSQTERIEVHYPLGHRRRRNEGMPLLEEKFLHNAGKRFAAERCRALLALCTDPARLDPMPVDDFMNLWLAP